MPKRTAEPITESATAKQRPVRNLSAHLKSDNMADFVDGIEHPSQTIKAGGNRQRQQSDLVSCCEHGSVNPSKIAGGNSARQQSKLQLPQKRCSQRPTLRSSAGPRMMQKEL